MPYNEFLMTDTVETKHEGRVLRVCLNRPAQRNLLTMKLCKELVQAFDRAEKDGNVGSVLLTGLGDSFCAGMEINEVARGDVASVSRVQETIFTVGARLTKPLIGAVQGGALGSGMGLVANCHLAIAAENATFGLTGIRFGLWPFVIFPAVSAAVGQRRALAMTMTGEVIDAPEALRIGLVHQVVPVEELEQRAFHIAQTVADFSLNAMHSGLRFVHDIQGQPWKAASCTGSRVREQYLKSPGFQADLSAFLNQKKSSEIG
jgi:enoyl-CoA hydratase/carnithine racemase